MSGELVELLIDGTWTDVTLDVRTANGITINRGKAELAKQAGPATASFDLNNRASNVAATLGQVACYSPRNPVGPYSGRLGRNTQARVSKTVDALYDAYSSSSGTGDLSFTHTPVGTPTGVAVFVWQYNSSTGQIAADGVTYGGRVMEREIFGLFTLGGVNAVGYMYWLNREIPPGPQTVAVDTTATLLRQCSVVTMTGGTNCELDASNFSYSNATPSTNPTMSLTLNKRGLLLGSLLSDLDDGSTINPGAGYFQLGEHDIGTETVSVERSVAQNPQSWPVNWTAASAHWGIMAAGVRAVNYRFWGEISELPPRTDLSHQERWVPVQAADILRRLAQGEEPAKIGLREFILSKPQSLTSYWPLSGEEGTLRSENLGKTWEGQALTRFGPVGNPIFKYGVDLGGTLGSTMELDSASGASYMFGGVGTGEQSGAALDFVWQSASMGVLQATIEDYEVNRWSVTLNNETDDATAFVTFDDPDVGPIAFAETAALGALQDNGVHHCRLQLIVDGADTDYELFIDGESVKTGTMSGYQWNGTACIYVRYTRYPAVGHLPVNLAHVTVWSENNPAVIPAAADISAAVQGYAAETAADRMERVAALAGIPIDIVGDNADTALMGVQFAEPTLKQIRDAEATDLGVLVGARDALRLRYRTRTSQYNQTPKLILDYAAKQVAPPFEPVDDDAAIRNDVTATRRSGDSFRAQKTTGPLSIQAPPAGVGPYADEIEVNPVNDAQLPMYAAWFLNLGTIDRLRFPTLTVNLLASQLAGLEGDVMSVDVGDLIRVINLDAINIYDDLDLRVVGYSETVGDTVHSWAAGLEPADLYAPAVYATSETVGEARFHPYSSKLVAGVNSSATSLSVSSQQTLWTRDPDAFPFDILVGGERITVLGIAGATSPQTFSPVVRSVNGVVKAQLEDAEVDLFHVTRFAM